MLKLMNPIPHNPEKLKMMSLRVYRTDMAIALLKKPLHTKCSCRLNVITGGNLTR